ncbi:hypothetical protein DACRYDRAFT_102606 [Dacryopinax primogenitus]|uniref:Alpha/beta-hydrolase n=1 Tax=Dacryopinax primogenitus (strain DJM 731) TaxID=1858805 RepID=M5FZD3_DACPD|nr:uncharacterized protein DACRYDRAFT_102606 [Dacryopinax primogenitus]EJT96862.1 hypothetical protein DACRYDRAFT_102606 [Dacryopinax primogenitus]
MPAHFPRDSKHPVPTTSTFCHRRKLAIFALSCLLVGGYIFREHLNFFLSTPFLFSHCHPSKDDWTKLSPGTVKWWDCAGEGGAAPGTDCGWIIVPTDYFNASAGVTRVALGRVKARRERQGIVLVNPGGPGGSGKQLAVQGGSSLQAAVTGETYDIVGFDPRGIGETLPPTQCFSSAAQSALLTVNTVLDKEYDVPRNASGERETFKRKMIEADALYRTQYAQCERMGDAARYMGTTTVARDVDFITRVLEGEEALINFWGASYGTILGQYLVNMFPDRVGRVGIDGVVDGIAWSSEPNFKWYRPWLSSTEDAYDIFLSTCSAAGSWSCPLTLWKGEEPAFIRQRLESWFDELYDRPLVVNDLDNPGFVTSGMARGFLFQTLAVPSTWPKAAGILAAAMAGEGKLLLTQKGFYPPPQDMSRQAVTCNDALPLTPSTAPSYDEVLDELLDVMHTQTKFVWNVLTSEPDSGCQYWPVSPPERFTGPWNHTLRNPIVIFSNTADPATPISSARLVRARLGSSSVLALQNGPGHCTISLPSLCNIRRSRAFFEFGKLPQDGEVCEVTVGPFPEDRAELGEAEMESVSSAIRLGEVLHAVRRA